MTRAASILFALLLAGCAFHRTTIVNVRADDHFDIRPVIGTVTVEATVGAAP